MAKQDHISDSDIKREVFVDDAEADKLTAGLIKDGKLVRDGDGYRAATKQ